MTLSKRPKGPEIEQAIRDEVRIKINHHSDFEVDAHNGVRRRVKQLESDLALLMAHLKLEFRDTPAQNPQRIVAKARKPKKADTWVISNCRIG